ncbi:hypothetical protein E6Q11_04360 [Candidatus Dojkabacteria bacterium]|uniref:Uncharacterized protein n=1 Tax=Candidatus Dojkabacteria bacterium TaxID=2099670 RepID=A0A5C7J509_9BACT|nr:MAG: hypothetical protein E6Q11_04360 [Candidatus Dojkabacteria bacterium]
MQETQSIFALIRKEINEYTQQYIEVVPGCYFNQQDTIKRIHLYINSKFENPVKFHGRERIFHNIVNYRRDTVAKAIDIDTKDIRLKADNPESMIQTFLAEKEFKLWMKQNEIGEVLNSLAEDLATYGTIVIKLVGQKAENVDLRRFFLDQTVKDLQKSRFVTQEHYMTEPELRKMEGKWDNIDLVIERFGSYFAPQSYTNDGTTNVQGSTPYYKIYERYGDVPEYMINPKSRSRRMVRAMFIVAEPFSQSVTNDGKVTVDNGVILASARWDKEYPYEDCHYSQVKGRWLGLGPVEVLFPAQERQNEMSNQKRIAMEISALHIFQTKDRNAPRNLMKYTNSGDVLIVNDSLEPVVNEERNLPAFAQEEAMYKSLADNLTFTFDATRGEALPSSTPATNAVIQNNNVNSYFQTKREKFGLFLERFFNKHVLPRLLKDISTEHMLRFIGDPEDIAKLDSYIAPHYIKKQVIQEILAGKMVDQLGLQSITDDINQQLKRQGAQRFLKIKQDFYKDSKFTFDFVITDEQQDSAVMAQNTFQIITVLAQNPTLIDDPVMKKLFYQYASMIGISPMELDVASQQRQDMKAMQQAPNQPGAEVVPSIPTNQTPELTNTINA